MLTDNSKVLEVAQQIGNECLTSLYQASLCTALLLWHSRCGFPSFPRLPPVTLPSSCLRHLLHSALQQVS
jgi:hypothetical protein